MMLLKPSSILHCLNSVAALAEKLFAGSALHNTIIEVSAIHEVGLDDHWRFLPQLYENYSITKLLYSHCWYHRNYT